MRSHGFVLSLLVAAASFAAVGQAQATIINHNDDCGCHPKRECPPEFSGCEKLYTLGDIEDMSITANSSDPGLVVHTQFKPGVGGKEFTLFDGECKTFKLFDIWTNEKSVDRDDTAKKDITVNLSFLLPDVSPSISGDTWGVKGIFQYGKVSWDGPLVVDVPGDRKFKITLSEEYFNKGLFGLNEGECDGATVEIKICQISSECPDDGGGNIPEPASLGVLGLGALGLMARRHK